MSRLCVFKEGNVWRLRLPLICFTFVMCLSAIPGFAAAIPGLFNSGVDDNRVVLPDGANDPHWIMSLNPDAPGVVTNAVVHLSTVFPIVAGPWMPNDSVSKWIAPRADTGPSGGGTFHYRITFDLSGLDPATARITGEWTSDNQGVGILINGAPTGQNQDGNFAVWYPFAITNGFVAGTNVLEFVVFNLLPGPTALRVRNISGTAALPDAPPTIAVQPQSQTVAGGERVVFRVTAEGASPLTYQWRFNGAPLANGTSAQLVLTNVSAAQAGNYDCIVTNNFGVITSTVAALTIVGQRIAGLFNTGVNDDGSLRDGRLPDLHYQLIASGDPAFPGPAAYVVEAAPIPPWMAQGPNSKWIAPFSEQNVGNNAGNFVYRTTFDMTGLDLSRARIDGGWSVDNSGVDVVLNGTPLGLANANAFFSLTPFSITDGFVPGMNTLDFIIFNGPPNPNPTGLRVEMRGISELLPPNTPPTILEQPRSQSVEAGQSVTFGVRPNGSAPFTYQWRLDGANIIGATARTYSIGSAAVEDGGDYDVIVANSFGTVTSTVATLTVTLPVAGGGKYEPLGPSSRRTGLVISEIMYAPAPRGDGRNLQFVELYNSNPYFEDLTGYRLTGDIDFTFPSNTLIQGNSFLVIAAAPADVQAVYGISGVLGPFAGALPLKNGDVNLIKKSGGVVLEVEYSNVPPWPVAASGAGHSLVLARPSYGERSVRAWSASAVVGGSPGAAEVIPDSLLERLVINEVLNRTANPADGFVELYDYSGETLDISGCVLSDGGTNQFVIPPGTELPARGFASFTSAQLGFSAGANGRPLLLWNPTRTRVLDAVRFPGQHDGFALARTPDGSPIFSDAAPTPGAVNAARAVPDVVINEVMYNPITGDSDDEFIELFNRGAATVNVGGWEFTDGISYVIPENTLIPPGGFLVVAKNADRMITNYPNLSFANTVGDYDGTLANSGERVALAIPYVEGTTTLHAIVSEVTFSDGGRWSQWSDGGGSSLELIDARADTRFAMSWADSDETAKSTWTLVEHTGRLDHGVGACDQLQFFLQGAGEALVDNIEVFQEGGANALANPNMDVDASGYFFQGTQSKSSHQPTNGFGNGLGCLRVRASSRGDYAANRIRTPFALALTPGSNATIRAQVRWLRGHPEILFRTKGNYLEAVGRLDVPKNLGTPGAPNSRTIANAGPAIAEVIHQPVLPSANQPITVSGRINDPDGAGVVTLRFRIDPSPVQIAVPMTDDGQNGDAVAGDGIFSAQIPGQPSGTLVAFHVQAADASTPPATTLFPSDAPTRECLVRVGDPPLANAFGTYRVWMTQGTHTTWSTREKLSNEDLDVTFVYGRHRVIYNAGGHYSGSPYTSPGYDSPTGVLCGYNITTPSDDLCLGVTDFVLDFPIRDATDQREALMFWMLEQYNLPNMYRRYVNLFVNGVQRGAIYDDVQQPSGDILEEFVRNDTDGTLWKTDCNQEFDDGGTRIDPCVLNTLDKFTTVGGQKKVARYRWNWRPRAVKGTANDFSDLFELVDAVNVTGAAYQRAIEDVVDVENWVRTWAMHDLASYWDAFGNPNGKNTFLYKPEKSGWIQLSWDVDVGLGVFNDPVNAALFACNDPLVLRMEMHPPFLRAYYRALEEGLNTFFSASGVQAFLASRYAAFQANNVSLASPFVPSGAYGLSIPDWITQRRNFIQAQMSSLNVGFAITSNGGNDFTASQNLVSLTGTAPLRVAKLRVNGLDYDVTWTSATQWSLTLALANGVNTIVVEGVDRFGQLVAGASDTIRITFNGTLDAPEASLVINEIMYNPLTPGGEFVEIHNRSMTTAFSLAGYRFDGVDFAFPNSTVIAPNSFVVVAQKIQEFVATYGGNVQLAGEYKGRIDSGGETLKLIRRVGTSDLVVNAVTFDDAAPWPALADGYGPSLQLIDPFQDNRRAANWAVNTNTETAGPEWQFVSVTGTASSARLYLYLTSAGDVFIDDMRIVEGTTPGVGQNFIQNGDFESPLTGPWTVSANHSASMIETSVAKSGSASLHMIASSGGSSQSSSIWQDTAPALTVGATYTLSYWYLPSTNGAGLVARLSGSGINSAHTIAPDVFATPMYTPGRVNSVREMLPAFAALWINELEPSNLSGIRDNANEREPWLEVFNAGTSTVSLDGFFLSDNFTNLTRWTFPANASIAPGEFKVIFADAEPGESTASSLHTDFRLGNTGGVVVLSQLRSGVPAVLDYVPYGEVVADRSFGSLPDGQPIERRDFFYPTPGAANNGAIPPGFVFINEWMVENEMSIADPADGEYDDWFEIYNPGNAAVNLGGYYFTDDLANKTKFRVPTNTMVPARGFLLVWADGQPSQNDPARGDLHVSFRLNDNGEAIGLFTSGGALVDAVTFGEQTNDVSQGRYPDGIGAIRFFTTPTPGQRNAVDGGNQPPVLAPIGNQFAVEGQTLTFTAMATDPDSAALLFSLDAGAPAGASINPFSGVFTWTPTSAQAPSTNTITIRVRDDATPPLDDSETITVVVYAAPRFTTFQRSGNNVTFTFRTIPGRTYRVEYKNDLNAATWTQLGNDIPANGSSLTITDSITSAPQRFYRVRQVD